MGEALFEDVFVGEDGLIRGDADPSGRCGEGETDLSVVGCLAEHQADRRVLVRQAKLFVESGTIKLALASVLRLELADLYPVR